MNTDGEREAFEWGRSERSESETSVTGGSSSTGQVSTLDDERSVEKRTSREVVTGEAGNPVRVPAGATSEETAAIIAALETYLDDHRRDSSDDEDRDENWHGNRWSFAGRLGRHSRRSRRVPTYAPSDPWTAAGRSDRY